MEYLVGGLGREYEVMADELVEGWERHTREGLIDRFLLKPVQVVDLDGLWDEEEVTRSEAVAR